MPVSFGPYAFPTERTPVFLAPMSGITDAPFRKQAALFGASVVVTEMVAGDDLATGRREAVQRLQKSEAPGPYVVQLVGREAEPMRIGASLACESGADIIDINMGCPSRRVTGGLSGSALMRDLDRAEELISAVLDGAKKVPVTLKMRLGWDWDNLNAADLSARADALGVQLITVHGRTRQDFYESSANWSAIADVVAAVDVPVIANGDIFDARSARLALKASGAAGVMVGRAATGLAWLPSAVEAALRNGGEVAIPPLNDQIESLKEQSSDCVALYGDRIGIRVIRKHLSAAFDYWASHGMAETEMLASLKALACTATDLVSLNDALNNVLDRTLEKV